MIWDRKVLKQVWFLLVTIPLLLHAQTQEPRSGVTYSIRTTKNLPPGWQDEWTPETFPNPQLQPLDCGRGRDRSWVCDPNLIITKEQADELDSLLLNNGSARCKCDPSICVRGYGGLQGSLAIIQAMYFRHSKPTTEEKHKAAEAFAEELREKHWKFGLCEDDYVIFLSKEDGQIYTATGELAKVIMTNKCISDVYEQIRPQLSDGDFAGALTTMVKNYKLVAEADHDCNRPANAGPIVGGVFGAAIALIIVCACCVYCSDKKRAKRSSGKKSPEKPSVVYKPAPTTKPEDECVTVDEHKRDSGPGDEDHDHHRERGDRRDSQGSRGSKGSGGGGGGGF